MPPIRWPNTQPTRREPANGRKLAANLLAVASVLAALVLTAAPRLWS